MMTMKDFGSGADVTSQGRESGDGESLKTPEKSLSPRVVEREQEKSELLFYPPKHSPLPLQDSSSDLPTPALIKKKVPLS